MCVIGGGAVKYYSNSNYFTFYFHFIPAHNWSVKAEMLTTKRADTLTPTHS